MIQVFRESFMPKIPIKKMKLSQNLTHFSTSSLLPIQRLNTHALNKPNISYRKQQIAYGWNWLVCPLKNIVSHLIKQRITNTQLPIRRLFCQ